MNIIILGCGRVGSTLARRLVADGHSVMIIDTTSDAFRRLGSKFKGQKLIGTGLDQDTLRKAGIEKADAFLAVTQGDNTNIMAAEIALKVFKVGKVLARFYDPIRAEAYRELGIDTFCTTSIVSGLFHAALVDDSSGRDCRAYMEALDQRMRPEAD